MFHHKSIKMQNRREFLKTLGLTAVCTCGGMMVLDGCAMFKGVSAVPVVPREALSVEGNRLMIDLRKTNDLLITGGAAKLSLPGDDGTVIYKMIIIRPAENEYRVFGDHCTHGGRELNYRHNESKLECSSFGHSTFDLNGQVTGGPAKAPLARYTYHIEKDILTIQLP